ncbi:MAG TPA: hypothetical protein VK789_24135 [Bryobacteraceae bacterium]|nr:hypothetical protein [Bryobacteraceae bacterium]
MKHQDRTRFWESFLRALRVRAGIASFAVGIGAFAGMATADVITVFFDPTQATPVGETGAAPAAETANNDFSLWGVQYQFTGGDESGCSSSGGYSLCFGDEIGTGLTGLNLSLLSDPVLSGPLLTNVALTLTFLTSSSELSLDVAVGTLLDTSGCPVRPESYEPSMTGCPASLLLYDASGSVVTGGTYQWTLPNDAPITEGMFSYSGPPVFRALLTFPEADSCDTEFAIDNLTYQIGQSSFLTAPEPPPLLLVGFALVTFGFRRGLRAD